MSSPAGFSGIAGIVVGIIGVAIIMTFVLDSYVHWLPIIAGIVVGLMAVRSINQ